MTFSHDRIDSISECLLDKYKKCPINLKKRFEHVVGVTVANDSPIENIVIWVSDNVYNYIRSKPIHGSQTLISEEECKDYRQNNPQLSGGRFLQLKCVINTELIQLIMSYTDEIVVLSPNALKNTIIEKIRGQNRNYFLERT